MTTARIVSLQTSRGELHFAEGGNPRIENQKKEGEIEKDEKG